MSSSADERLMAAALALSERGRAQTGDNPNVGCILVKQGRVIGRGWTQMSGRPHAEAMAVAEAGASAQGATAYVTLEPCAHESARGPACVDSLIAAGVARVVVALQDPDPRTDGAGIARLEQAGIAVAVGVGAPGARRAMAGWLMQQAHGRPFVTLKLATSLDGCIATASGESRWITGEAARAHGHLERARSSVILVGGETVRTDAPLLTTRLPGLEGRSPAKAVLTRGAAPDGWHRISEPADISTLGQAQYLLVEGGAGAASAFLAAGLVDRVLLYRAPMLLGGGKPCLGDIGLAKLSDAHTLWQQVDTRLLGKDQLDVYERA